MSISSWSSQSIISPKFSQEPFVILAVGSISRSLSISLSVSLANFSELVIKMAGDVGPCSA